MTRRACAAAILLLACASDRTQPTVVIQPTPPCADESDRVARALCVVHRFVEEARKNKDIVKLTCLHDKETQLEAMRKERDDGLDSTHQEVTDAKADRLERESERCIGELARTP